MESDDKNIYVVDIDLRAKQIASDKPKLAKWTKPDPVWHLDQANEFEKNNQWFAAAFHLRKLIEIEPSNMAAKKRLQFAENNLKEGK